MEKRLHTPNFDHLAVIFVLFLSLGGCGSLMSSATQGLANSLANAVLNSNDPATVAQGLPAYLLLLDGLLEDDPNNLGTLLAAADLNNAYAGVFAQDPKQAKILSSKALDYARRAFCVANKSACGLESLSFAAYQDRVANFNKRDINYLYTLGSTWTGWIDTHKDDWNAVAQIDRAKLLLQRVVEFDDRYKNGFTHIYLGSLATLLPPALGGKPNIGKEHFEKAINYSDGKNLMAQVNYARRYARLLFERELHDRLLNEVLEAEQDIAGLRLSNTLAKEKARLLLDSADEYF